MKLIQLNVWAGRLQNQVANLFKSELPDIICLQEAISFNKEDAAAFYTIENIQRDLKMKYSVVAPTFSFKLMEGVARFGNCIITSQPVDKSEVVFTNLEHKDDFDFNHDSGNARNFVHSIIRISGKPTNIITHHGYWVPEHKNGNEQTLLQMKRLSSYMDSLSGPIILTGDFNLAPNSESLNELNNKLRNLSVGYNLATTRNKLTHKTEVCDYIFVNNQIKVREFSASDELVSDHKALILEFDV